MALTLEYLHEILEYDPLTGELRNRINRGRAKAGFVHQAKNTGGYITIGLKGRNYVAQKVIWFMMTGAWSDYTIDHEDTNRTNNVWTNLREATHGENMANRKVGKNNALGIKGVTQRGKRFAAHIWVGGEYLHLGYYDTADLAGEAYKEAAKIVHGEFARAS